MARNPAEVVGDVALLMVAHPEATDEQIVSLAVADGIPELEARLADAFLPIAYGRAFIREQGWAAAMPDEYQVKNREGTWVVFKLTGHPLYRMAADRAEFQRRAERQHFSAIVSRSAEVNAISQMLYASPPGTEPRDLVFSPAFLLDVTAEEITDQPRIGWWERLMAKF